ncbi:MAG: hypothetical protein BroJett011_17300 [Chloroflexota bacterium]|nr:MAG: hypothetical protein BroJett011_17300 [Chloroflexota bacterium]
MNVEKEIDSQWRIPDVLWALIVPLLPPEPAKPKGGRPRIDPRQAMDGIFYHLRTGCQWKAIPRSLVAGSTAHDYFQLWQEAGLFYRLWHETEQVGWPGISLVGAEGAEAAWVILQHAIGSSTLQRQGVLLLAEAIARGEMAPQHLAYLEDRICFFERRPQRYGTQFDWDEDGQLSSWMLDEPDEVDRRRAEMGFRPLAEHVEKMRRSLEASGEKPPADYEQRQAAMLAWAKSVGWL